MVDANTVVTADTALHSHPVNLRSPTPALSVASSTIVSSPLSPPPSVPTQPHGPIATLLLSARRQAVVTLHLELRNQISGAGTSLDVGLIDDLLERGRSSFSSSSSSAEALSLLPPLAEITARVNCKLAAALAEAGSCTSCPPYCVHESDLSIGHPKAALSMRDVALGACVFAFTREQLAAFTAAGVDRPDELVWRALGPDLRLLVPIPVEGGPGIYQRWAEAARTADFRQARVDAIVEIQLEAMSRRRSGLVVDPNGECCHSRRYGMKLADRIRGVLWNGTKEVSVMNGEEDEVGISLFSFF